MKIIIIDGQGGSLGKAVISRLLEENIKAEIIALGTNSTATQNMIKGNNIQGATKKLSKSTNNNNDCTETERINSKVSDPLSMYLTDIATITANLAGVPALSLPYGVDNENMPVGVQLIGPALGDADVLNAAFAYQQKTDYHKQFTEVQ